MDLLEIMVELDIYLFGSEKYEAISNRIRSFGIICILFDYFSKTKIYSYDSFPIERLSKFQQKCDCF